MSLLIIALGARWFPSQLLLHDIVMIVHTFMEEEVIESRGDGIIILGSHALLPDQNPISTSMWCGLIILCNCDTCNVHCTMCIYRGLQVG